MRCKYCGEEIPKGVSFCRVCGAPVSKSEKKARPAETPFIPMLTAEILAIAAAVITAWLILDIIWGARTIGSGFQELWNSRLSYLVYLFAGYVILAVFTDLARKGHVYYALIFPPFVLAAAKLLQRFPDWAYDYEQVERYSVMAFAVLLLVLVLLFSLLKDRGRRVMGIHVAGMALFTLAAEILLGILWGRYGYLGRYVTSFRGLLFNDSYIQLSMVKRPVHLWKYYFPLWAFFIAYILIGIAFAVGNRAAGRKNGSAETGGPEREDDHAGANGDSLQG